METTETPTTVTPPRQMTVEEIVAEEIAANEVKAEEARKTHAGRIVSDFYGSGGYDGDYYHYMGVVVADPVTGETTKITVASDGASAWHGRSINLPKIAADATPEILALVRACEDRKAQALAEERAREERASVGTGKFVLITSGRNVPIGTVGRVFWRKEGQYGWRIGVATSTETVQKMGNNGRVYDSAKDVAWSASSNATVLLQDSPSGPSAELLYRFAKDVAGHIGPSDPLPETFPAVWATCFQSPEVLAAYAAYTPEELPWKTPEERWTLSGLCEALRSDTILSEVLRDHVLNGDRAGDHFIPTIRTLLETVAPVVPAPKKVRKGAKKATK